MPLSRAACLTLALHLSLIPSPLLALKINSPVISTSVIPPTINIDWNEESGDPQFFDIQIQCGSSSILDSPIQAETSIRDIFINRVPAWMQTFTGECYIQATDGSRLLATSANFLAPQLFPIPQSASKTTSSKNPATKTLLSSFTDIPGPTPQGSTASTTLTPTLSTGARSSITPAPKKISTNTPFPTLTTSISMGDTKGSSPQAAVIGGVIGSLAFLALLLTFGFLYLRRRKAHKTRTTTPRSPIDDLEKTITSSILPSLFHNRNTPNTTVNPMIIGEDYHQPEGKRERFLRMKKEMNDARRQRELLRSNLSTRSGRNPNNKESRRDSEGVEIEGRLRQELECMSHRIIELETQLTEVVEPPPDYTSSNHA